MSSDDYIAVIAIDFGTTFSGYAFSMKNNKNHVTMNKNWGADAGFRGYKTPTTVLLGPDGSTHAFGFQAETEFNDLDEDERKEGYLLFQRFKMELFSHKKLDSNITIKSTTGEERPALAIIAKALTFMKNHCLQAISKLLASGIADEYIRWVITVPAIWSDTAKKFMRLAAKQAAMVKDILSQNLIIALEPEAASLYCRTLALDKFVGMAGAKGDTTMKPGERYMIVDCGGGTIDITVHECVEDGKVQEVMGASGGPWGGIYVDRKYFQLLYDIFGVDFMNTLKRDHPSTWLDMMIDFETKKRGANPESATGIRMNMFHQFAKEFEKHTRNDIAEFIKTKKDFKYSNGVLRLSSDTLRDMYSDVIPQIRDHLRQLLRENNGDKLSKMFVVGGFAESAYVQECLTSEFGRDTTILIPEEAGMCVMKGAVLFGHDQQVITSRIARFNYGVPQVRRFNEDIDDASRKIFFEGKGAINAIKYFVRRNQRMYLKDTYKTVGKLYDPSHNWKKIELMCTKSDETDDPGHPSVTVLESVIVQSPNVDKKDRMIEVSLCFGGTDILFKATDLESGNIVESLVQI